MTDPEEQEIREMFSSVAVEKFRGVRKVLSRAMSIIEDGDVLNGLRVLAEAHTLMRAHATLYAAFANEMGLISVEEGTDAIEAGKIDATIDAADFDSITPADFL